jgi:hypothetical protein
MLLLCCFTLRAHQEYFFNSVSLLKNVSNNTCQSICVYNVVFRAWSIPCLDFVTLFTAILRANSGADLICAPRNVPACLRCPEVYPSMVVHSLILTAYFFSNGATLFCCVSVYFLTYYFVMFSCFYLPL